MIFTKNIIVSFSLNSVLVQVLIYCIFEEVEESRVFLNIFLPLRTFEIVALLQEI